MKYWLGGRIRTSVWRNQNPTISPLDSTYSEKVSKFDLLKFDLLLLNRLAADSERGRTNG